MTASLSGVVVVTGGSMGIGYACAEEVVRCGASVVIAARGLPDLDAAAARLNELGGGRVSAVQADATNADDARRIFDRAAEMDLLCGVVHAAGVYGPIGPLPETEPAAWWDAVRTNLFGTYLIAGEACRRLREDRRPGSIVLMAGGGAASPFPNYTAYAVSKAAVVRLAETLALEMAADHIRVNAVAPGFVGTRLHDQTLTVGPQLAGDFYAETQRRLRESVSPQVAARAVGFLLSDESRDVTGRFLAAPYDDWAHWPEHSSEIQASDLFTLRRIVPRDRGMSWG